MRMYDYHENGLIEWQHHFAQNFLSILVYKKVRIKIHLYTLPVKKAEYKKTFRSAFGAFSNIEDGTFREITDSQNVHIRCLT